MLRINPISKKNFEFDNLIIKKLEQLGIQKILKKKTKYRFLSKNTFKKKTFEEPLKINFLCFNTISKKKPKKIITININTHI